MQKLFTLRPARWGWSRWTLRGMWSGREVPHGARVSMSKGLLLLFPYLSSTALAIPWRSVKACTGLSWVYKPRGDEEYTRVHQQKLNHCAWSVLLSEISFRSRCKKFAVLLRADRLMEDCTHRRWNLMTPIFPFILSIFSLGQVKFGAEWP